MYKTALICVGNELLSGETVNTNLSFIAQQLLELGLPLSYSVTVGDEADPITQVLKCCLAEYDLVITTGGLGPTNDDLTKKCAAALMNKELVFEEELWYAISRRFSSRGKKVPAINRSQAEVPRDFIPLKNNSGTAPGLFYESSGVNLIMLPGVPSEMKTLFAGTVKPLLQEIFCCSPVRVRTIHTIDISESELAELVEDIAVPGKIKLAFLSQPGKVDLQISGTDTAKTENLFSQLRKRCVAYIWGFDDETLAGLVCFEMRERDLTLAVAESCTGGLIQKMVTDIPGASKYFSGGIVAYNNQVKTDLLAVSRDILSEQGAVSNETAREMAEGVRKLFKSDLGAAVTGIAGPEGGTAEKPVGTVHFAVSYQSRTESAYRIFAGSRQAVRENSAMFLLNMIRKRIKGIE